MDERLREDDHVAFVSMTKLAACSHVRIIVTKVAFSCCPGSEMLVGGATHALISSSFDVPAHEVGRILAHGEDMTRRESCSRTAQPTA